MELRHLRYFQAVAEELSYSKAAVRLRIAQPALSRAVQELEQDIGALLFDRGGRTIRLTPAGTVLLRDTGLLFDRLDETVRRVRRTAAGEEGELRLGYIGPPTRGFLGPLLKAYRERHPKVTVVLEERTPERVAEMVSKGRLSIGLTRPVVAADSLGLKSLVLWEEPFAALVAEDHPLSRRASLAWRDLAGLPVIVLARREGAGSHDTIRAACEEAGFSPKIAHTPSVIGYRSPVCGGGRRHRCGSGQRSSGRFAGSFAVAGTASGRAVGDGLGGGRKRSRRDRLPGSGPAMVARGATQGTGGTVKFVTSTTLRPSLEGASTSQRAWA